MKRLGSILALSSAALAAEPPLKPDAFYAIEKVLTPPGIEAQVGGVAVMPDGRLAACFHHGEVAVYEPKGRTWKTFAEGLHEPLGLLAEEDGSLLVMQRPELTRLRDTNGDGAADVFETVWDGFGMTGNYHEFAFGPARGPDGRLYVGLNLASQGASIREEIRGPWSDVGVPREEFYRNFKARSAEIGRMYSRVAWRGWIMAIDPKSGDAVPVASGFRSPDGLGFDAAGNLLVSDNQGDWRGSSEVHVVKNGGFYGHPASLVWRKDWDGTPPLKVPLDKLNALRTPAAIWLPQGVWANSPTQLVQIPGSSAWGAFGGQMLLGEMNEPRLFRVMTEQVNGVWQGAVIPLVSGDVVKRGLHRLAFSGDTLYVGRTHLSWVGGEGLFSLKPKGALPFDPLDVHLSAKGFRVRFTDALAASAADPAAWGIVRYTYNYWATYGSPQVGRAVVQPEKVEISADGLTAEVTLPGVVQDYVYDFTLGEGVRSHRGQVLLNPRIAYTVRSVPK